MIIDCDSHFLPPNVYKHVDNRYQYQLPTYDYSAGSVQIGGNDPIKHHDNPHKFNTHCELLGITDVNARLDDLKKLQVDMQVIAPQDLALRFNYSVSTELAIQMAHSYNLSIINLDRTKFIPVGYVPLQSIEASINEVIWLKSVGINQVYVDFALPNTESRFCSLWRNVKDIGKFLGVVEKNDMILYAHHFMHKLKPDPDQMIHPSFPADFINGFLSDFILGGLLDQFPKLTIVIAESPKLGADLVNAMKTCVNVYESSNHKCMHPTVYFKRNFYVTVDIEATEIVNSFLQYFGEDNILFSTDYPHSDPSGMNKWNDVNDLSKLTLPNRIKEKIAYKNANTLFKLNLVI